MPLTFTNYKYKKQRDKVARNQAEVEINLKKHTKTISIIELDTISKS